MMSDPPIRALTGSPPTPGTEWGRREYGMLLISCHSSQCNILGVMDVCKRMQTQAAPSVRGEGGRIWCNPSYTPKQMNNMFHYATMERFTLPVLHSTAWARHRAGPEIYPWRTPLEGLRGGLRQWQRCAGKPGWGLSGRNMTFPRSEHRMMYDPPIGALTGSPPTRVPGVGDA
jgi:hypothetical protein